LKKEKNSNFGFQIAVRRDSRVKVQVLSQATVNYLTNINGMIIAACSDGKHSCTTVDGGSIRNYPINVEDLTQTTDDVFTLKQSPITCVDSTRDTGVPNRFIIGCADGNLYLCSSKGRVEKAVPAHTGGATCVSVNPDRFLIASGDEDRVAKVWNRNGIRRTNLASLGGPVTSCNWDNTGKYLMFTV
jgi:WD40 repeat protein